MIKQLLAKNGVIQRFKAIKDLFLQKLDYLIVKLEQNEQNGQIERSEKLEQLNQLNSKLDSIKGVASQIVQENTKNQQNSNILLENNAFLLKFAADMVKGIGDMTGELRHQIESNGNALLEEARNQNQSLAHTLHSNQEEARNQNQSLAHILHSNQEEARNQNQSLAETLTKIYQDIHNQKFKVVTDQQYFQDIDIELMTYLYSHLPYRRAIDIGANRGDVSARLLQTGYEVYAFEPFPPVLEKLSSRFRDNPNFHVFSLAIGSANETKELHIAADETESQIYQDPTFYSSLTKHSLSEGLVFTDTIPVTVRTLETLHQTKELPTDIGLVKIDTEGFDLEVIKGMGAYRYPVVVAEFWDANFPFGRSGAMNHLKDMVAAMKERHYHWHIVIYRVWGSPDISYYCNSSYSLDNSWGNVFFFQDYQIFNQALMWCSSVMPATYFSA